MLHKYYVIPDTKDDTELPTTPEPMPLEEVSAHIIAWIKRYDHQGYYSNCKMEHLPLNEMQFRIAPVDDSHGFIAILASRD